MPHKKKKGLQKIPWNKNKKGFPAKDGSYWDQQFPDGTHKPKYL